MKFLIWIGAIVLYVGFAMLLGAFMRAGSGSEPQTEYTENKRPKLRIV